MRNVVFSWQKLLPKYNDFKIFQSKDDKQAPLCPNLNDATTVPGTGEEEYLRQPVRETFIFKTEKGLY